MNYYFDTEFIDDGKTIDLISIGLLSEDQRHLYLVSAEYDESKASDWLKKHVLNHISRTQRRDSLTDIAITVSEFIKPDERGNRIWGWYPAYDWVALCQLYGPMISRPPHFPKRPDDLKALALANPDAPLPKQAGTKHNAFEDARWVRDAHEAIYAWRLEKARNAAIIEAIKSAGMPPGYEKTFFKGLTFRL